MTTRDELDRAMGDLIHAARGREIMRSDSPGWQAIADDAIDAACDRIRALLAPSPAPDEGITLKISRDEVEQLMSSVVAAHTIRLGGEVIMSPAASALVFKLNQELDAALARGTNDDGGGE